MCLELSKGRKKFSVCKTFLTVYTLLLLSKSTDDKHIVTKNPVTFSVTLNSYIFSVRAAQTKLLF